MSLLWFVSFYTNERSIRFLYTNEIRALALPWRGD